MKKIIIVLVIVLISAFLYWQNRGITINYIQYKNKKIPSALEGYKILQVSDLHNTKFGQNQKHLIRYTKRLKPDLIVITGDIIDCHRVNVDLAIQYVRVATKIAPVYYVSGNHEIWSGVYPELKEKLQKYGVKVLEDEKDFIDKNGATIEIIGIPDRIQPETQERLEKLIENNKSDVRILLTHRPEYMNIYKTFPIDLVFAGHAHGGQIRLPFIGGLYAPGQGLLPDYTSGAYEEDGTTMVVSRGLGNSVFPFRILNRPELVVVELN